MVEIKIKVMAVWYSGIRRHPPSQESSEGNPKEVPF